MPFEFGDVVLVPFPFTQPEGVKKAACACRQQPRLQHHPARPDRDGDHQPASPESGYGRRMISHWQAAGLLKPSVVKPVFATLEQRLVLRRLGALDDDDRAALRKPISEIIG